MALGFVNVIKLPFVTVVLCIYSKKEATMSSAPIQMDVYTHYVSHTCTDTSLDTHTNTYALMDMQESCGLARTHTA